MQPTIVFFAEDACRDARVAGGKGASLAAMTAAGLPVPPGFAIAAHVLADAVDGDALRRLAEEQAHADAHALVRAALPPRPELAAAYERLGGGRVAVRSSAAAEDGASASFAGQQETYLGVEGLDEVAERVVDCWASFFTERALFYRSHKGSLADIAMAVVVQRMVEAEKAGVLFTVDPVQRRPDQMIVEAVFGLGEQLVAGEVTPDHHVVARDGSERKRLAPAGVLDEGELVELARLGRLLEEHFGGPQDVEWAIAGGQVFLLQSRPVTAL